LIAGREEDGDDGEAGAETEGGKKEKGAAAEAVDCL
jgi:hypothetical protein